MRYKLEIRLDGELYHAGDVLGNELCKTRMEKPVIVLEGYTVEDVYNQMRELATIISSNGKEQGSDPIRGEFICFPGSSNWGHICYN